MQILVEDLIVSVFIPPPTAAPPPMLAAEPQAMASSYVVAGSLITAVGEVGAQHFSDVLNSTLLAQFNANTAANRFDPEQGEFWRQNYMAMMSSLGWSVSNVPVGAYNTGPSPFSVGPAVDEILASTMTARGAAQASAGLAALKGMAADQPARTAWASAAGAGGAGFQIGAFYDNMAGPNSVSMTLGFYGLKTSEWTGEFLWTDYSPSDTQLSYGSVDISLDDGVYSQYRDMVTAKLAPCAASIVPLTP